MKVTVSPNARSRACRCWSACWLAAGFAFTSLRGSQALATEAVPPKPVHTELGSWPDAPSSHDVVVPVLLTVDRRGVVERAEVEVSLSPELDQAALRAARRWRFEPASVGEKAVSSRVRVAVRFLGTPEVRKKKTAETSPPQAKPRVETGSKDASVPSQSIDVLVVGESPMRSAGDARLERDILQAAPGRTGSDLLRRVPGVFVSQHSGQGKAHQIFFRGFDAVHGQDVEVSVAGVPVNEVSHVHGQGYADLHFVIPEVVQQLDARPGALRPDQGDFAIAGSVLYHLGLERPGATVTAGLGNYGTKRLLMAYRPEHAPAPTFAAFELYSTDGFGTARAVERASAMGQVQSDLADDLKLRAMASTYASRFESAGVLRQRDIEAGLVDRFASYDPDQGGSSARTQVATELTHVGGGWHSSFMPYLVTRQLRLRFNFTGEHQTGVSDNSLQFNDSTTLGFKARTRKPLTVVSQNDTLELGLFTRHDRVLQGQRRTLVNERLVDAKVQATNIGAFADLGLRPWAPVALHLGLRADSLAFTVDDRLNRTTRGAQGAHMGPKASIKVALSTGLSALAGYGAGFRSPQARSLGDGEGTPFSRVHSFDAGFVYSEGPAFVAALGGYASLLTDDLVFNEATSRNEPAPATARLGALASFEARASDWFVSACGGSLTRATFRESNARYARGEVVPFVPQLVGRCDLSVTTSLGKWRQRTLNLDVGVGMETLLNRPLPYGELGDDVFLLDGLITLSHDRVSLGLETTNLLDAAWYDGQFVYTSRFAATDPSAVPLTHVTAGEPRTFLATLTLRR